MAKTARSFIGPIATIVQEMRSANGGPQGQRYLDAAIDLLIQAKGALMKAPSKSVASTTKAKSTRAKLLSNVKAKAKAEMEKGSIEEC